MSTNHPHRHLFRSIGAALVAALGLGVLAVAAGPASASSNSEVTKPVPAQDVYVAMGDSFTAGTGTGLPDYDDANCQRSTLSYPALVTDERPNTQLTFVACGFGVTTESFLDQVEALDQSTDFVTLTLGGNDLGFAQLAGTCIGGTEGQCLGLAAMTEQYIENELPGQLDTAYAAVRGRVHKAEVIVVGYPRFYADDFVPCMQAYGITVPEAVALNDLVELLDGVIGERAEAAGFTYVSTVQPFTGHDMCASAPWINGFFAPTELDRYHPTAAGYEDGFTPLVLEAMETREPSVSQVHGR